jgi:hypothetical protein
MGTVRDISERAEAWPQERELRVADASSVMAGLSGSVR